MSTTRFEPNVGRYEVLDEVDALVYQRKDGMWVNQPIDRFSTFDDALYWGREIYGPCDDAFQFAEEVMSVLAGSPALALIEHVEIVQPGWLWVCKARLLH